MRGHRRSEAPNGDIMPATAPATRSNGRLILGLVVLLLLAGALGYGFWQHYTLHAEVMATADQRRDFVPSVRTAAIQGERRIQVGDMAGNDRGLRAGQSLCPGQRLHLQAHRRYRQPGQGRRLAGGDRRP